MHATIPGAGAGRYRLNAAPMSGAPLVVERFDLDAPDADHPALTGD
jgi:hypothetical protein